MPAKLTQRRYSVRTLLLIMIMGVAAPCSGASAAGFLPDRPHFFESCAVLTNFQMSGSDAVAAGKGALTDSAKTAISGLFDVWERQGGTDPKQLAFILATARRESAGSWKPIREAPGCGEDEICREKAIGALLAKRAAGKNMPVPENYAKPAANGQRYYGRGYIQLTFESNYTRADGRLGTGTTLHDDPDKVMALWVAQTILVRGMLEGGSHKPLSFYLDDGCVVDWINARNNVNPGSPNKPIAARSAQEIVKCLREAPAQ